MKKKAFLAVLIALSTLLSAAGCGGGETVQKDDGAYERALSVYENGTQEMMIGAHGSPPATAENFRQAKEMGLTHFYVDDYGPETLAAAEAAGLRLIVSSRNALGTENPSIDWSLDFSEEKYALVDAIGYYDEPMPDKFDLISQWADKYNEKYDGNAQAPLFMVNLHPMDGFPNANFPDVTDEDYIRSFCEKVLSKIKNDRILSYDLYPIRSLWQENESGKLVAVKNYVAAEWLRSLELMAKYSAEYGARAHAYLQTMGFWVPYDGGWTCRVPSEADIRLQAYTSLAFGIRDFSHFAYWSTDDYMASYGYTHACTYLDGTPNDTYYAAKAVNEELLKLHSTILCFEHQGNMTFVGSENPEGMNTAFNMLRESVSSLDAVSDVECTADTVIGQFRDGTNGYDGLVTVNYNETSDIINDTVELTLKEGTGLAVFQRGEWKERRIIGGKVTLDLAPGDGVFAIVLK